MKKITALIVLLTGLNFVMAQDTAKIFINEKLAGAAIAKGEENISTVKIKKLKKSLLKSVSIQLNGNFSNNVMYKKTIQAYDGDVVLLTAEETKTIGSSYSLPVKLLTKKLIAGNKIKLVLQLDPANDKMLMPSRIITLCYIMMQ